ncbi:MAG: formylglycine-generating enzyme family protein [Candidatus Marinimicrobia bacterium]|nr:formylglycine-generating enzyme family protein [Candidatus Neomarinimicrobiota bacterium]
MKYLLSGIFFIIGMLNILPAMETKETSNADSLVVAQNYSMAENYFNSSKNDFYTSIRYSLSGQGDHHFSSGITKDYGSESEYFVENAKFWRRNFWIGLGGTAILDALGIYFNSQAVKSYGIYEKATNTKEATAAIKNTDTYSTIRNTAYSVSLVPLGFAIYSMFREKYYRVDGLLATSAAQEINDKVTEISGKGKVKIAPIGFVFIMGGKFSMGDQGNEGNENEKPVHTQTVEDFYISKMEVTQSIYEAIMKNNPSQIKGPSFPVENITWYQALEFCNMLSENENLEPCYRIENNQVTCNWNASGYRLPTEKEWEFAARSRGRKDRPYSGTDRAFNLDEYAWYNRSSYYQIQTAGMKLPNELGIYDMTGNVREWCWNSYADYPLGKNRQSVISNAEKYRVVRGGGWGDKYLDCRTTKRFAVEPDKYLPIVGFRIVKSR